MTKPVRNAARPEEVMETVEKRGIRWGGLAIRRSIGRAAAYHHPLA